jgi:hypothetical protein
VLVGATLSETGVGVGLGETLGLTLGVGLGVGVAVGETLGAGEGDGIAYMRTVLSPLFATKRFLFASTTTPTGLFKSVFEPAMVAVTNAVLPAAPEKI